VRESERDRMAAHERHFDARREQIEHEHAARADRSQWASVNHGRPTVAASARAGEFHRDVVAARGEREAQHRADRPAERREDRRADGTGNAPRENRNAGRNDRPTSAVNRENGSRPNTAPSNNVRQARESRPVPQGEARGNPQVGHTAQQHSNVPQGETHRNPHVDQRSSPSRGNSAHESTPHSNSKAEHGKPDKKP